MMQPLLVQYAAPLFVGFVFGFLAGVVLCAMVKERAGAVSDSD